MTVKFLYKIRLVNILRDNQNNNQSTAENGYNIINECIHSAARVALGNKL